MSRVPLKVLVTEKANADVEQIEKYISRKFGRMYADKFRSKLIDLFKKIAVTPTAGRTTKNNKLLRVFVFERQNKVVYKITQTNIEILRLLSARRKRSARY